jgi:transcriptional regulator with XRE-family HTH domain
MDDRDRFRARLAAFVDSRGSRSEAADDLGVARMTLYRYLNGRSFPRPSQIHAMELVIGPLGGSLSASEPFDGLDQESVTRLRNTLLHLVRLIDLDVARGRGE